MVITFRNNFHNTSVQVRVKSLDTELSIKQSDRVRRVLCGDPFCTCEKVTSVDGDLFFMPIYDWKTDKNTYIIYPPDPRLKQPRKDNNMIKALIALLCSPMGVEREFYNKTIYPHIELQLGTNAAKMLTSMVCSQGNIVFISPMNCTIDEAYRYVLAEAWQ